MNWLSDIADWANANEGLIAMLGKTKAPLAAIKAFELVLAALE